MVRSELSLIALTWRGNRRWNKPGDSWTPHAFLAVVDRNERHCPSGSRIRRITIDQRGQVVDQDVVNVTKRRFRQRRDGGGDADRVKGEHHVDQRRVRDAAEDLGGEVGQCVPPGQASLLAGRKARSAGD